MMKPLSEFEKALSAIEPGQGETNVMQIMFRAGQLSVALPSQVSKAGVDTSADTSTDTSTKANAAKFDGWKVATGFLTAACVCLMACLAISLSDAKPQSPVTLKDVNESKAAPDPQPVLVTDSIVETNPDSDRGTSSRFYTPELSLDDPSSWRRLGYQARHLVEFAKRERREPRADEEMIRMTPFRYQKMLLQNSGVRF